MTPDSKIYCEKDKMCRFSSGNWFFCTKFVQLAVAGKRRNTVVHLLKKSVKNWSWLRLSISDWSIIMIGPGGLLIVVPTYMLVQLQIYLWGCQKRTVKLRHLILLSRVTYWVSTGGDALSSQVHTSTTLVWIYYEGQEKYATNCSSSFFFFFLLEVGSISKIRK